MPLVCKKQGQSGYKSLSTDSHSLELPSRTCSQVAQEKSMRAVRKADAIMENSGMLSVKWTLTPCLCAGESNADPSATTRKGE